MLLYNQLAARMCVWRYYYYYYDIHHYYFNDCFDNHHYNHYSRFVWMVCRRRQMHVWSVYGNIVHRCKCLLH